MLPCHSHFTSLVEGCDFMNILEINVQFLSEGSFNFTQHYFNHLHSLFLFIKNNVVNRIAVSVPLYSWGGCDFMNILEIIAASLNVITQHIIITYIH